MEFKNNVPIYLQIIALIKKEIITGKLKPGEKIPSVRSLSESYMVNLNTVQKAYSELERQGIIFTKRGMGNFVSEDTDLVESLKSEMCMEQVESFLHEMEGLGFSLEEIIKILQGGKNE